MNVYTGTVLNVAQVTIEPETMGGGAAIGGVAGGVAVRRSGAAVAVPLVGRWRVRQLAPGQTANSTRLHLSLVELDDGRIMVVVQEEDDVFVVGDRIDHC